MAQAEVVNSSQLAMQIYWFIAQIVIGRRAKMRKGGGGKERERESLLKNYSKYYKRIGEVARNIRERNSTHWCWVGKRPPRQDIFLEYVFCWLINFSAANSITIKRKRMF